MKINWTSFCDEDPPRDRELLVYYENGALDKGYIIVVKNSGFGWRLPEGKTYVMRKWVVIE